MENRCYLAGEIHARPTDLANRPTAKKVLLCAPDHFAVVDEKNIHMRGNIGHTDTAKAQVQWSNLQQVYTQLKANSVLEEVHTLPAVPGLEDMVFCANQTLPWIDSTGTKKVVMSKMRHPNRQREVAHVQAFFEEQGYAALKLPNSVQQFEGMGDAIPHPGKRLLYGGYGHRTHPDAYRAISQMLDVPIVALELVDDRFYHLDTCFLPISEEVVLVCEAAFSAEGLQAIGHCFEQVIAIPESEAVNAFALNAHVVAHPNHAAAIIQPGANKTNRILEEHGYTIYHVETSEFMQSGGSVFCMKMMFY